MNFICFDTEDNSVECMLDPARTGFDKRITQIAAKTGDGKKYYNAGDVPAFLKWLERQPEKFIYAHNLQYDLGNLFSKRLDGLDATFVGGRLIKAKFHGKTFVDSFNIWPMAAAVLAPAFGLEKLKTTDMAQDKDYVFQDVEIIWRAMSFAWQFCAEMGLDYCPPTLGGLCVKIWKHYGGENVHDSTALSREAYYGGRVELFKTHNESPEWQTAYTDINSLYPSVMLNEFPGEIMLWESDKLPKFGVAKITVTVPKSDIPVLPYRNEDEDGRILFPWGTFSGAWTIAEINAAVKRGAKIKAVHECFGTNDAIKPYGNFVESMYKARLASNSKAEKLFFKLLMNNLYGRLGTGGEIGRTVNQTEKNRLDGVPYGEKVLVNYQMPLPAETNWLHAAYVTSYGRLRLLEYMEKIGADRMIYCDTDSTFFDCADLTLPFETNSALGEMKSETCCRNCRKEFHKPNDDCPEPIESDFWPGVVTFAPKQYKAGNQYKAKGVPKRLQKEFVQTGSAHYDLPFKFREAIRFYDRANARELSVWRNVQKINAANYDRKKLVGNRYFPCKINRV